MQQVNAFSGLWSSWRAALAPEADASQDDYPSYNWPDRAPRRSRKWALRAASITVAAMVGGGLFWMLTRGTEEQMQPSLDIDVVAGLSGFGIDQVALKGHRFTPDGDIFDALKLDEARSIATFDIAAAQAAVEELPWVEYATITRVYPDQLVVDITERKPFALWQRGKDLAIVDAEGRLLSAAERHTAPPGLLQIAGDGAATEAKGLVALLSAYPDLLQSLQLGERVAGRRWRLHLADDIKIELPANGPAAALAELKAWPGFASVMAQGQAVIDVRTKGRIAVRTTVQSAGGGAEPRNERGQTKRAG